MIGKNNNSIQRSQAYFRPIFGHFDYCHLTKIENDRKIKNLDQEINCILKERKECFF